MSIWGHLVVVHKKLGSVAKGAAAPPPCAFMVAVILAEDSLVKVVLVVIALADTAVIVISILLPAPVAVLESVTISPTIKAVLGTAPPWKVIVWETQDMEKD